MSQRKSILFVIFFLLHALLGKAQRLPFINYTPAEGLINNRVRSLFQDSKGRMYFMTYGGLSVYDGARFMNYDQGDGLAIDVVNDILEITPDSLWVATNTSQLNGLVKGRIVKIKTADGFCPVINSFFRSGNGSVYAAADDGLFIWSDKRFKRLPLFFNGKDVGRFIIQVSEVGRYLLVRINPGLSEDAGSLYLYEPTEEKIISAENEFITFSTTSAPNADTWIASSKGIFVLKKETLEQGKIIPEDPPPSFGHMKYPGALFIKFDRRGQLWISIYGEGLLFQKINSLPIKYNESSGLGSSRISYIMQDKEDHYWFLPEGKGAQKLVSDNIELFDHPLENSGLSSLFAQNESDSVWLFTNDTRELVLSAGSLKKTFSLPIVQTRRAEVLASGSSIYIYDARYVCRITIPVSGNQVSVKELLKDTSLLTSYGIVDPYGSLIYCADDHLKVFQEDKSSSSYPVEYFVDQVCLDPQRHLWIMTRAEKIMEFSLHPEDPAHYLQLMADLSGQIPAINPRSITVDDSGRIWVGTRYNGLYCFQNSKGHLVKLYQFTRKEGLTDNFINYLHFDHFHNIWASSPAGLDKLEIDRGDPVIKNITRENNLFVSINKVQTDKSGVTWALNESGNLLKIYPKQAIPLTFTPLLYISRISCGSVFYSEPDFKHSFSYRQNNMIFSVAAPSFYDEKQIRYSYLLSGSGNKEWSDPSRNADLNFVNLAPGQYILNIKAIFPGGHYPTQTLSYPFEITPPWWQTWWFRFLFIVAAIVLIVYAISSYYNRVLEKQRTMLEKKQAIEKERTRIASDMHDDLGAGLSTIRFLSEKVKRNSFGEVTRTDAEKIVTHSDELVQKMNEIIWAMNEKNDTLEDLVFYTRAYAMEFCEQHQLQCEIHVPDDINHMFLSGEIRRNIFLTVKECLHNIVKHAEARHVTIDINIDKDLDININDDGRGFSDKSGKGGGNGLRNMQKRIETIGGQMRVTDGKGVSIELKIPI